MTSKDDLYTLPKKRYCLLINGGKLHVIDIDTLSINKNNIVQIQESKINLDKEAFILIKNRSLNNPKYFHATNKFVDMSLDDTARITSYYSIYQSSILDTKIFTVALGHLGYSRYLKNSLEEGGYSKITYYKNTGLIKKKYVDNDSYSDDDDEESSVSSISSTRSTKAYKNDIKVRKNPERETTHDDVLNEISRDMVKEIALFEYVKSNTSVSRYITEMYYIDLKNSEVYFPKYTELKYKNRHFKPRKHFYQIIYTLYVLQKHGIMHGDLKPYNIFIDKHTGDAKIGDWGLMQIDKTPDWSGKKAKVIQTQSYRAPEVHFTGKYTYKADIWSLGLMMLEASVKMRLTRGSDTYSDVIEMLDKILCCNVREECKKNVVNGKAFLKFKKKYKDVGKELSKLVYKMMSPNQNLRPTYEEILSSPYFEEFKFQPIPNHLKRSMKERKLPYKIRLIADELDINEDILRNTEALVCSLPSSIPSSLPENSCQDEKDELCTQLTPLILSCKLFHKNLGSVYTFMEEVIEIEEFSSLDMYSTTDSILAKEVQMIEDFKYKLLY